MSALSEKLRKMAELNFCKDCYHKYLVLIQGEIECLLSEPISDWRQTEQNINFFWIKAKGLYDVNSTIFSPHQNAFKKAGNEPVCEKLKYLKEKGIINEYTNDFLNKVRKRRNNVHPPTKFSKQDYFLKNTRNVCWKTPNYFESFAFWISVFHLFCPSIFIPQASDGVFPFRLS